MNGVTNSPEESARKNGAAGEPPAGELPAPEVSAIEKELEEVRAQATENLDKFLRAKAETDNVRRRAENDVAAAHKYAVDRFASEIVAVRDSLDLARAVDLSVDNAEAVAKMREGLELTLKLLDDVFRKFGITVLDPAGEKFDPTRHQAISMVGSVEVPAGNVVTVVQKGYLLHDRVLRPAMVVVAKPKPGDAQGSASAAEGRTS
jgi:molecular chaperone GrpE